MGHMAPYKIKKECYFFKELSCWCQKNAVVVDQVFPWIGGVRSMYNADTQSTVEGRQEAKGQEKIFMFKFFSCHKMGSQRVGHD